MRPRVWIAAILISILQTGAIAGILIRHAAHLSHGREMVLRVVPVDPRDFLRGDYVRLSYPISRIEGGQLPEMPSVGMPVYVTLERQGEPEEGNWKAVTVSAERPASPVPDNSIVLKGKLETWFPPDAGAAGSYSLTLTYGIETYFLEEDKGREVEKLEREGAVKAVLSVDSSGVPAIKTLIVEGKRLPQTGL